MKEIPTSDTIVILQHAREELLNERVFSAILKKWGDDYYIHDGEYQLCKENEERKKLIKLLIEQNEGNAGI